MTVETNKTNCIFKFEPVEEQAVLYFLIATYFCGIFINTVNIFLSFYVKRTRKRTINQLHSVYPTGNTIVMVTLLVVTIYNGTASKFTCETYYVTFICYMFGNSLSISFLLLFTKVQYQILMSIHQVITAADKLKRRKKSLSLFAVVISPNLCLISAVVVFEATKVGVLIVLYNICLNAACVSYSYKCHKTHLGPNLRESGTNSQSIEILRNAKNVSKILNNAVILTGFSHGITLLIYLALFLQLSSSVRRVVLVVGQAYIVPLIIESVIYLSLHSRIKENRRIRVAPN